MTSENRTRVDRLIQKGIRIDNPDSVYVGRELDLERISSDGVVIHTGCKFLGAGTLILPGVEIGREGPATVDNCQIGPNVSLNGGYFKDSVFLAQVSMGLGSHVRQGCILEEQSSAAHTVALKQTILFPFVTLGSLINFCDCFMAGGTSRKDHSEVGSAYIHFNYTPDQDKATPSLIGDVPRGVMLDQRPIFLGGQGGLVGPTRLEYGTVAVAGSIIRKDELKPGRMIMAGTPNSSSLPFNSGGYRNVKRIAINNLIYIANLTALKQWYHHVRGRFVSPRFPQALLEGLKDKIDMGLAERIQRLGALCEKMANTGPSGSEAGDRPAHVVQQQQLYNQWPSLKVMLVDAHRKAGDSHLKDVFLETIETLASVQDPTYIDAVRSLSAADKALGTKWLQGIVDDTMQAAFDILPVFGPAKGK